MFSIIKKERERLKRGFSLIELLLYAFILIIVVFFIVESIIGLYKSQALAALNRNIEYSGETAMNKIINEIKGASSVNTASSSFGISSGVLYLSGTKSGTSYTMVFSLQNSIVVYSKDGGANVPMTSSDISVTNLMFKFASTTNSTAVKVDINVSGTRGSFSKSLNLLDFAVLRNSY